VQPLPQTEITALVSATLGGPLDPQARQQPDDVRQPRQLPDLQCSIRIAHFATEPPTARPSNPGSMTANATAPTSPAPTGTSAPWSMRCSACALKRTVPLTPIPLALRLQSRADTFAAIVSEHRATAITTASPEETQAPGVNRNDPSTGDTVTDILAAMVRVLSGHPTVATPLRPHHHRRGCRSTGEATIC